MNIDKIDNNVFLKKVFPAGLTETILLGKFSIDLSGYCNIDFHVRQEPKIKLNKFGNWNEDFNIVVLKLKGKIYGSILINKWLNNDFVELIFEEFDDYFVMRAEKNDFKFYVELEGLIFQELSAYIFD